MKQRINYFIFLALAFAFISCSEDIKYPNYSLVKIDYIPDSLKIQHRTWITETVRAASQNMTGGDYENVDETILQAERTADNLFKTSVIGLKKKINDNYWDDLYLNPNELNYYEKNVLDSLLK